MIDRIVEPSVTYLQTCPVFTQNLSEGPVFAPLPGSELITETQLKPSGQLESNSHPCVQNAVDPWNETHAMLSQESCGSVEIALAGAPLESNAGAGITEGSLAWQHDPMSV